MEEHQQQYGFTEDKVFGWVMENNEFCQFVLQIILPQIDIAEVENLSLQKALQNSDRQTKDVRLDILVRDKGNCIYNIEMQVADQDNLGRRMRYYLSKVDAHYTLEKNESYNDLKETYIIFLCNFDYPGQGRLRYVFHEYEDQDRSLMLPANSAKVIINAKGKLVGNSQDLQNLANPLAVASTLTMHSRKLKRSMITRKGGRKSWIMKPNYWNVNSVNSWKKQGITETVNSTIEQLKAAGNGEQETYCFIQKLNTGLSDDTLHEMVDQYY